MIKEALQYLTQLARDSNALLKIDSEPSDVYFQRAPDGTLHRRTADPPPRASRVHSLQSFIAAVKAYVMDDTLASVWVSSSSVVAVLDDETRRDRITFPVTLTRTVKTLKRLEDNPTDLTQAALIRLFRVDLASTLEDSALLDAVRSVKFTKNESGESTMQHGMASLGRSVQAELAGTGGIPGAVTLSIRIFEEVDCTGKIICAIEIDVEKQCFRLLPIPGQLPEAIRSAENELASAIALELDQLPVFQGVP